MQLPWLNQYNSPTPPQKRYTVVHTPAMKTDSYWIKLEHDQSEVKRVGAFHKVCTARLLLLLKCIFPIFIFVTCNTGALLVAKLPGPVVFSVGNDFLAEHKEPLCCARAVYPSMITQRAAWKAAKSPFSSTTLKSQKGGFIGLEEQQWISLKSLCTLLHYFF